MSKFKIRKKGGDLHTLKEYNSYEDGAYNALYPEYAPKSVGGTMSGVRNKDSKGNCTWYAFGRLQEATGYRVPLDRRRGNAKDWVVDSHTAKIGSVVVFVDSGYGHVAFVEEISGNDIILSESAYSERGNDFLFKYGRTVADVCKVWGMSVKGYITSGENHTSYDDELKEIKEDGFFKATEPNGSNIRKEPKLNSERVNGLPKGEEIPYTHYVDNDGIRWVKTSKGYIARRKLDNSQIYGDARFSNQTPVEKPKPTIIGKYANMSGNTWLFKVARTDETYPNGYSKLTDLRNRSAKILADDNGRVKISVPSFNPEIVWVAKSQISITDKPKFEVN